MFLKIVFFAPSSDRLQNSTKNAPNIYKHLWNIYTKCIKNSVENYIDEIIEKIIKKASQMEPKWDQNLATMDIEVWRVRAPWVLAHFFSLI